MLIVVAFAATFAFPGTGTSALAASPGAGVRDQSYGSLADPPTASKPESKLWFAGGYWWADMVDAFSGSHHIFRLDRTTQSWEDTGVEVDPRRDSHADALYDAPSGKLYIASHEFTEDPGGSSSSPARLWRFSYDALNGWTVDPGFPATIANVKSETLVIAKDSTGVLWATWMLGDKIYVNHSVGVDAQWSAPAIVPGGTGTSGDDISSIIAFGGDKVGLMWSNEHDQAFHFAVHQDGAPDTVWSSNSIGGMPQADDHINLKADAAGRVYAAVKHTEETSTDPLTGMVIRNPSYPFISMMIRSPTGSWSRTTLADVADNGTRPIVLLEERRALIHVFFTESQNGGDIVEMVSPMANIGFRSAGTAIKGSGLNNVTSTKQNLDAASGLVLLATDSSSYYHADRAIPVPAGSPPPPPPPPAPAVHTTPTPPGAVVVAARADAEVRSTSATANFGSSKEMRVAAARRKSDPAYRSFMSFDVPALEGPVVGAALRLTAVAAAADGGEVFAVGAGWEEPTLKWAGAPGLPATPAGKVGRIAQPLVQVALDPAVFAGGGRYAFAIAPGTATAGTVTYRTREAAAGAQLVLTVGPPPPKPVGGDSAAGGGDAGAGGASPDTTPGPGGPPAHPAGPPSALTMARAQRGTSVRGQVAIARPGSRLIVTVYTTSGKRMQRAGQVTRRRLAKGRTTFSVELSPRAGASLRRHGRLTLVVRVRILAPRARTGTLLTRRVVLRPPRARRR